MELRENMKQMTALVLAAGLGLRMGPRGCLTPKGLIELGGEPMISQSIAALRAYGIGRIRIVTGHLAEQYRQAFAAEPDVELIHNPRYSAAGSLLSLSIGLKGIEGSCLILESDLIYAPEALECLDGSENRLVVSGPTGAGDEVYVWAEQNQLIGISKDVSAYPARPLGELVGITALTAAALPVMQDVAEDVLCRVSDADYEAGLVEFARRQPLICAFHSDLAWAEIDTEAMLTHALQRVYPRIVGGRAAAIG